MDKRVILAVAGAGKTYHICHSIDPQKRNLILAFTHENIHNIRKELIDAHGSIPERTTVMTFDSFVYRHFICPYEPTIADFFDNQDFRSKGITTVDPPPQRIENGYGGVVANPKYKRKDQLGHYITKGNQYYCATISELVVYVKRGRESLIKRAAARLNLFFDQVLIDEFQDFREHDYDLIDTLSNLLSCVLLVGDYYQHSVSGINNTGRPFKNKKADVGYTDYVAKLKQDNYSVDETTLNRSRRCPEAICAFVREKLGINIESTGINQGGITWLAEEQIDAILQNPSIQKLVYNSAANYSFNAMNWSYSKGDTVDVACVILTDQFEGLDKEDFSVARISLSTINKLYVALTRSKGDLYLIKASIFKKLKDSYTK